MATDASILLGLKPMQTTNPMEMYEAGQRLETNRLAGIMNNAKLDEYQRSVQDAESQRGIVKGFGADATANANMLMQGGHLKAAQDYSKAAGDLAKDNAATGKTRIEAAGLAMTQHRDQVNMIQSPDDVKRWLAAGYSNPDLKPIFERYGTLQESLSKIDAGVTNPQQLAQWKLTASTNAETLLKQLSPDANARLTAETSTANNTATNLTSRQNNAATVGASYANAAATRDVAQSNRDSAKIQTGFANEQGLRKEFEGLPEVKNYKQAFPAYAAIKDATGRNTTQSDINIVYGLAKLYDPTSVVREGEYATVANSPNIPEKVKGYAQYLQGGGRLSPETKRQIMAEATGRIGTYEAEAAKAKASYEGIAKKRGMDSSSVFADMGNMTVNPDAAKPSQPAAMPPGFKVIR